MTDIEAKAEMLIACTRTEAFDAFADREQITQFWLRSASGDLAAGACIDWEFLVPGARETVEVLEMERDCLIRFRWGDGTSVRLTFDEYPDGGTRVGVVARGFSNDAAAELAVAATEGFTIVLCDLKVTLETGRSGDMVRDKARLIAHDSPAADAD